MSDHEALCIARASFNAAILPAIEAEMARLVTKVRDLTMEVARLKDAAGGRQGMRLVTSACNMHSQ